MFEIELASTTLGAMTLAVQFRLLEMSWSGTLREVVDALTSWASPSGTGDEGNDGEDEGDKFGGITVHAETVIIQYIDLGGEKGEGTGSRSSLMKVSVPKQKLRR